MLDLAKNDDCDLEQQANLHLTCQLKQKTEDTYEKQQKILQPLPQENVPNNYPQENRAYLVTKCYVQLGKYELHEFIFDNITMPTVMESFK